MTTMLTLAHRLLLTAAAVPAALLLLGTPVASATLPDGRVYELVSPTASPTVRVDVLPDAAVSSDGNKVAFQTFGDRNAGPSNRLITWLATRGSSGWSVQKLSAPQLGLHLLPADVSDAA